MAYLNHALTVGNFFGFILVVIPLLWHLKASNVGTCFFIFWCGLGCLLRFINTIIWNNTTEIKSATWCKMSARLVDGAIFGIPAAILSVNRRLYIMASNDRPTSSRIRMISTDVLIAFLLPAILTGLLSISEGYECNLLEDIGCIYPYYNTIPDIIVIAIPPLAIALVSGTYGILNIYALYKRYAELRCLFSNGTTSIDFADYLRLLCLSSIDVIFTIPIYTWVRFNLVGDQVVPWSWARLKENNGVIHQYTREEWEYFISTKDVVSLWSTIFGAVVFFGFFGLHGQARERYRSAIVWLCRPFRNSQSSQQVQLQRDTPCEPIKRKPDTLDTTITSVTLCEQDGVHEPIPYFTFGSFSVGSLGIGSAGLAPYDPFLPEFSNNRSDRNNSNQGNFERRVSLVEAV